MFAKPPGIWASISHANRRALVKLNQFANPSLIKTKTPAPVNIGSSIDQIAASFPINLLVSFLPGFPRFDSNLTW